MRLKKQMKRHFGRKATQRIYAAAPWVGSGIALLVGTVLKRRGGRQSLSEHSSIDSANSGETTRSTSHAREVERDLVSTP